MITTTTHAALIRTTFTASNGDQWVFVTYLGRGPRRIEMYLVDPSDAIEMFQGFADPEQPKAGNRKYAPIASALIMHQAALESRKIDLTPIDLWPLYLNHPVTEAA